MAVPITLLFFLSIGWVLVQGLRRRGFRLPRFFLFAWLVILAVAWVIKLTQHFLASALASAGAGDFSGGPAAPAMRGSARKARTNR